MLVPFGRAEVFEWFTCGAFGTCLVHYTFWGLAVSYLQPVNEPVLTFEVHDDRDGFHVVWIEALLVGF